MKLDGTVVAFYLESLCNTYFSSLKYPLLQGLFFVEEFILPKKNDCVNTIVKKMKMGDIIWPN